MLLNEIPVSISTLTSLGIFVLTVATGYITLMIAYAMSGSLDRWYDRDSFDKVLQSFVVGFVISVVTLWGIGPPLDSDMFSAWLAWAHTLGPAFYLTEFAVIFGTARSIHYLRMLYEWYRREVMKTHVKRKNASHKKE